MSLLTSQERECLRLVAQQRSSKEIAGLLGISKASVDTYCNRARSKLGVASRRDAAQLVLRLEERETTPAVAEPPAAPAPAAAPPPSLAALSAISRLGPLARLGLILAGALVIVLAFGMLVSGLSGLNEVVTATHWRPAADGPAS